MSGGQRWNGKAGSSGGGRGSVLSLPPPSGGFSRNDDLLPHHPTYHSLTHPGSFSAETRTASCGCVCEIETL